MQYYSVIILAILLPQSHGSVQNPSRSIRGSSIESITNMQQPQLATHGGCMKNSECPDDYYCHVDDGDCLSGNILGECYEMTARRTRSLRNCCGCDGVTYTDRSYAVGAGVNVWHLGDCEDAELA